MYCEAQEVPVRVREMSGFDSAQWISFCLCDSLPIICPSKNASLLSSCVTEGLLIRKCLQAVTGQKITWTHYVVILPTYKSCVLRYCIQKSVHPEKGINKCQRKQLDYVNDQINVTSGFEKCFTSHFTSLFLIYLIKSRNSLLA